jgi:trehalose 6-phosphate synthase
VNVVVSNRGPYSFVADGTGNVVPKPAPGGLASSLGPLLTSGAAGDDATWIAAALDEPDRAAARAGIVEAPGIALRLLDIDPALYRMFNDVVANQTLWFLHHGLFDLPRRPRFDQRFVEAWAGFEAVSRTFAEATAESAAEGATVLVQDYQLALVPGVLRELRPDLHVVQFTHIPFCGPNSVQVLPTGAATALCSSMAAVPCGFHAARWAKAYEASAREVLGADAAITPPFVASLGPDPEALAAVLASDEVPAARQELDELVGDRKLLLRVDRIDPSKNIVRGFAAYGRLLEESPEWRERVVFVAKLNASREHLPEYQAYAREVELAVARINERWATSDWEPVVLETSDSYINAIVALARYDVLVVNPIKDGLNLVAKEGPIVNERDGVLCLSPGAGAWDELGSAAVAVHPFDLEQTAGALRAALEMPEPERAERAKRLRVLAGSRTPAAWFDDQLKAAVGR